MKKALSIFLVMVLILINCSCKANNTPQANSEEFVSLERFADMLATALEIDLTAYNMESDAKNQGMKWLDDLKIIDGKEKANISVGEVSEIFDALLERNFIVKDESLFGTEAIFGDESNANTMVSQSFAEKIVENFKNAIDDATAKFDISTEYKSFLSADIILDRAPDTPIDISIDDSVTFVEFINAMPIENIEYAGAVAKWDENPDFNSEYGIEGLCNIIFNIDNNQNYTLFVDKGLQKIVYNNYCYTVQKGYLDKIEDYINKTE